MLCFWPLRISDRGGSWENWTKWDANNDGVPDPVIPNPDHACWGVGQPSVIFFPTPSPRFYLYFTDTTTNKPGVCSSPRIYLATSTDGINFNRVNNGLPVFSGNEFDVVYVNDIGKFFLIRSIGPGAGDQKHQYLYWKTSNNGMDFGGFDWEKMIKASADYGPDTTNHNPAIERDAWGHLKSLNMAKIYYGTGKGLHENASTWDMGVSQINLGIPLNVPLYRFNCSPGKGHFYSLDYFEGVNKNCTPEGNIGYIEPTFKTGTVPLKRFFNPNTGRYFYTSNPSENPPGWIFDGIEGYVYVSGGMGLSKIYRLYHPVLMEHLYTNIKREADILVGWGWRDEGHIGYSYDEPILFFP
jgi:hypothetical protein